MELFSILQRFQPILHFWYSMFILFLDISHGTIPWLQPLFFLYKVVDRKEEIL